MLMCSFLLRSESLLPQAFRWIFDLLSLHPRSSWRCRVADISTVIHSDRPGSLPSLPWQASLRHRSIPRRISMLIVTYFTTRTQPLSLAETEVEAAGATSSHILLSRGVAGSDTEPGVMTAAPLPTVATLFESNSHHIMTLSASPSASSVRCIARNTTPEDTKRQKGTLYDVS